MLSSVSPEAMVAMALSGTDQHDGQWVQTPVANEHRRSRRVAIPGVFLAVEAPGVSREPWVSMGVDLNSDGMGLTLPPQMRTGTEVRLTFRLDGETIFRRLPAVVVYQQLGVGAVRFVDWSEDDRAALAAYLYRQD